MTPRQPSEAAVIAATLVRDWWNGLESPGIMSVAFGSLGNAIAAVLDAARRGERERCAKIAEDKSYRTHSQIAAEIRSETELGPPYKREMV